MGLANLFVRRDAPDVVAERRRLAAEHADLRDTIYAMAWKVDLLLATVNELAIELREQRETQKPLIVIPQRMRGESH